VVRANVLRNHFQNQHSNHAQRSRANAKSIPENNVDNTGF